MPSYLVELYMPTSSAERRAELVSVARRAGAGARYLRTIFLAEEETCFHEYESASRELLGAALAGAGLNYERLIETEVTQ